MQEDLFFNTIFQQFVSKTMAYIEWMEKSAAKNKLTFNQRLEIRQKKDIKKIQKETRYFKVGNENKQVFDDNEYYFRNSPPHFWR